jgi:hypothetical protein
MNAIPETGVGAGVGGVWDSAAVGNMPVKKKERQIAKQCFLIDICIFYSVSQPDEPEDVQNATFEVCFNDHF